MDFPRNVLVASTLLEEGATLSVLGGEGRFDVPRFSDRVNVNR